MQVFECDVFQQRLQQPKTCLVPYDVGVWVYHNMEMFHQGLEQSQTCQMPNAMPCRFLGLLHMEVFHQRLEQEHGADVITTAPTVPFHIHFPDKTVLHIQNP